MEKLIGRQKGNNIVHRAEVINKKEATIFN